MADYAINTFFGARDRVSSAFDRMGGRARNFGNRADKAFDKASKSGARFGNIIKGILGANIIQQGFFYLKQGLENFITQAQMIEDASAKFTPLMGSVERATELVDALNQTAATTPHTFEEISGVASQLLPVMNGNIEDTIAAFRMLGDTAGGNAQKLESITRGYVKALLKGKPDMESLNMIAEAGVPIFTEMAASMGITQNQLFELSKQGKLTKDDLTKTFQRMTTEGGIFYRGMEIASETLTGKLSTLQDNINLTFAEIGSAALPILKDFANKGIEIASNIREWVKANKELVQSGIKEITKILGDLFNLGKQLITGVITPLTEGFSHFTKNGFSLSEMINNLITTFQPLLNTVYNLMDFVGSLIGTLGDLWNEFDTGGAFGEALSGSINYLASAIQFVIDVLTFLKPVIEVLLRIFMFTLTIIFKIIGAFGNFAGFIYSNIIPAIQAVGNFFAWIGKTIWDLLDNPIFATASTVFAPFLSIPALIVKAWEPIKNFFIDLYKNVFVPIMDFFANTVGAAANFFVGIGKGIGEFFTSGGQEQQTVQQPPNYEQAQAQMYGFNGTLNINGAPEGSTFNQDRKSKNYIDVNMLGANP